MLAINTTLDINFNMKHNFSMQHKDAIPKLQSAKHINPNIDIYSNSHLSLRFFFIHKQYFMC